MLFWCSWFKYGFIKLDLSQWENFALISSVVDCVSVNPSTRLNHVLRDAQKVCALTIVGTVLKYRQATQANSSISSCNSCLVSCSRRRENSNSAPIVLTVDIPIPNWCPRLLKLSPVASLHSATVTLASTFTGERILVCCFCRSPRTRSHKRLDESPGNAFAKAGPCLG